MDASPFVTPAFSCKKKAFWGTALAEQRPPRGKQPGRKEQGPTRPTTQRYSSCLLS